MMTAIAQEMPQAAPQTRIPPHVLIVGKKHAVDYIAPALFRLGSFGELVVRAKGSLSIVTAVNVAEMVKKDVEGLQTRSINIGTEEFQTDGVTRRVSFIEIHLAKPLPVVPVAEEPIVAVDVPVHEDVEAPVHVEAPVTVAVAAPAKKVRMPRKKAATKEAATKKKTKTTTTTRKKSA
jgi:DNA-binding protein Alba